MTKEALKLALDALEGFIPYLPLKDEAQCNRYDKAITALRLAIDMQNMASKSTYKEQLETKNEPVPWEQFHEHMAGPNYVAPQSTWVGLTQEEFEKLINDAGFTRSDLLMMGACIEQIVDLVEAKLKEKNNG